MSVNTDGLIDKYITLNPNYRNDVIELLKKDMDRTLGTIAIGILVSEFGVGHVNEINKSGLVNDLKKLLGHSNENNDVVVEYIMNVTI